MIPAFEQAKTVHALDRSPTVTGHAKNKKHKFNNIRSYRNSVHGLRDWYCESHGFGALVVHGEVPYSHLCITIHKQSNHACPCTVLSEGSIRICKVYLQFRSVTKAQQNTSATRLTIFIVNHKQVEDYVRLEVSTAVTMMIIISQKMILIKLKIITF
jgi:hypothetical protein